MVKRHLVGALLTSSVMLGCSSAQRVPHEPAKTLAIKTSVPEQSSQSARLLARHNQYRAQVGVANLAWSKTLEQSAEQWAAVLAMRGAFEHSDSEHGENLWQGTRGRYSAERMVDAWADEAMYFIDGPAFPDVSSTGNWADVGHYTQLVWKNTTHVGCSVASNSEWDILVCQYSPAGNVQGQTPF